MAEPILRDSAAGEPAQRPGPRPVPAGAPELPPPVEPAGAQPAHATRTRLSSQEMMEDLRKHLQDLTDRIEKAGAQAGMSLRRELSQDANYIKIRARYYHERRPLQALGMVAMATFALGLIVGFWRR